MHAYTFNPIGYIRSCFKEKFGIPRQSGLVTNAYATLEIEPRYCRGEAFRELTSFSHIWLLFVFHQCLDTPWRPTVRPPRLGGNQRVGVFASRSGFRPNPVGQSAVELIRIDTDNKHMRLHLAGVDLMDGTPVLDIKPYLPYADCHPQAQAGYASDKPNPRFNVCFSEQADQSCQALEENIPSFRQLIIDLLAIDPRPGYASTTSKREYGMRLWDVNIRFRFEHDHFVVETIEPV